jgi:hypothetical protein
MRDMSSSLKIFAIYTKILKMPECASGLHTIEFTQQHCSILPGLPLGSSDRQIRVSRGTTVVTIFLFSEYLIFPKNSFSHQNFF